ncbi:MAG TPA: pseudouridine synthase [Anaerolineales bacterium]
MPRYLAFFKPYEVLSQFTDEAGRATLKDYIPEQGVYAAGRLDYRSEGLLLLSDDGPLIQRLTDPRFEHTKTYLAQVEGILTPAALRRLQEEIVVPGLQTLPARVEAVLPPDLPPRSKPVRLYHPTSWLRIELKEGKKHQVRRMTAAVGFPTLRLVRVAIGSLELGGLQPGEWRHLKPEEVRQLRMFPKDKPVRRET